MKLTTALIGPYKSIDSPQTIDFDSNVTVLVGQNEAGKSALLEALFKTRPMEKQGGSESKFLPLYDYPRKDFNDYERAHPSHDTAVTVLTYALEPDDLNGLSEVLGCQMKGPLNLVITGRYDNAPTFRLTLSEEKTLKSLLKSRALSVQASEALAPTETCKAAIAALEALGDLHGDDAALLDLLRSLEQTAGEGTPFERAALAYLTKRIPTFLYFSDYYVLPSEANLVQLKAKAKNQLSPSDEVVLALLNIANVNVDNLINPGSSEAEIARLEAFGIKMSNRVFEFWKQNEELEVRFALHRGTPPNPPNPADATLDIRIYSRRHQVSLPFRSRSRGFIWFFSFLVWFEDAQRQSGATTPLILLLDEPGPSLHALGQADLLRYIERLGQANQLVYTTHSPFLVDSDKLQQVRLVEDRKGIGTIVLNDLSSGDPNSLFPLQAALGYTIAQNLFIAERNLLVEGPADLLILLEASQQLEAAGRPGLDEGIVLVPTGGLDKVATFIALLRGNQLKFAVCVDWTGAADQRLRDMVVEKLISAKALLDYSMFRNQNGAVGDPTDVEDLFSIPHYLDLFNETYGADLNGTTFREADLPAGKRVVDRLNRLLAAKGITLLQRGGFNHYRVARRVLTGAFRFESHELDAFQALFSAANAALSQGSQC